MKRHLFLLIAVVALAAAAAYGQTEVKGSVFAGAMMPTMDLPHANAWAIDLNEPEMKMGHEGELGEIKPGKMNLAVGYGVSIGDHSRFDANVSSMKKDYSVTYTGEIGGESYERNVTLSTHIVPVTFDYTFITPGFFGDMVKPELGLGVMFFIAQYNTAQDITLAGQVMRGTAWARNITFGPEMKAGAEIAILDNLTIDAHGTYFTAPAWFDDWYFYDAAVAGPRLGEFTGWAIWLGPRYYFP
jgi:opacity protein-like surface antigen